MRQYLSKDSLVAELAQTPDLTREELIERWQKRYGRLPPKGISRRLLEYSAAYELQVQVFGSLKQSVRRRLEVEAQSVKPVGSRKSLPVTRKTMPPGARLVREWHGRTHVVDVADDGFHYDGQHFRSLSEIARSITGARWSGPRFFGL